MRGEVALLTRNVKIVGDDTDAWGCQIVTSDFIEGNGEWRRGRTYVDNVEVYNCSQYDTKKAAFRFEGAMGSESVVSNSAIHHGLGMGVEATLSANVTLVNNTIFDFVKYGINLETVTNVTLDGNWVFYIHSRHLTSPMTGDPQGAILGCANTVLDVCFGLKIVNNVVGGVESGNVDTTGYSVYGHECGDYKTIVFKNNVAHSINGYGAIIFKNESSYT